MKPRQSPYYTQAEFARAAGLGCSAASEAIRHGPPWPGKTAVATAAGRAWTKLVLLVQPCDEQARDLLTAAKALCGQLPPAVLR
jgi:hypothetical protein